MTAAEAGEPATSAREGVGGARPRGPRPGRPRSGRPRPGVAAALTLLALALLAPGARPGADTKELGGVRVTVDSPWPPGVLQGWLPVSVTLSNLTGERREVEATTRQSGTGNSRAVSRQRLEPGEIRRLSWLVPVLRSHDTGIDLDLRVADDWGRLELSEDPGSTAHDNSYTLVALADGEAPVPTVDMTAESTSSPGFATVIRHDALPSDWRAYTSLARLIVSTADGVPGDGAMDAILAWVAAGGVLQVAGDSARLDLPLDPRFAVTPDDGERDPDLISLHRVGLGWIQRTRRPRADLTPLWRHARQRNTPQFARPGVLWGQLAESVNPRGAEAVPVRLLASVLVLFFLAMGPLQFWLLAKRKARPVTLLLTTPVLGFSFSALVLGTSLFFQGLSVRQLVTSVTWLDQTRHHAASLAQRSVYSGSLFDSSLAYDAASASTGLVEGIISRLAYQVDLDHGVLSGSYLPVRAPASEVLARSATARQRLSVEREGEALFVVNGLGVELLDLSLADEHDQTWQLDAPLAAGERRALTRGDPLEGSLVVSTDLNNLTSLDRLPRDQAVVDGLRPRWPDLGRIVDGNVRLALPGPRTYVALLAESPFLDDGGVERTTEHGRHLLFGDLGPLP